MSDLKPAIVVVAFDRDRSLKRLLLSLSRAKIGGDVDLVISIDKSDNRSVYEAAQSFRWDHGAKKVLLRDEHMGLRRHVMACGDLTETYGSIVLLEDDLFVSPCFYSFAKRCLEFYESDSRIAGVSLYSPRYNETTQMTFRPVDDGSDVFFLQIASSWGQCWTHGQWKDFRSWFAAKSQDPVSPGESIPSNVLLWPKTSWKKHFIRYMIETNRFFVYPRESFSTNFHDPGTHHCAKKSLLQVPLAFRDKEMRFTRMQESIAVYDSYHEILPEKLVQIANDMRNYDFETDLYGQKNLGLVAKHYILTSRPCEFPIKSFGKELKPIELNIVYGIEGTEIRLAETSGCQETTWTHDGGDLAYFFGIPSHFLGEERLAARDRQWEIQMAQREHIIRAEHSQIIMSKDIEIRAKEQRIQGLVGSLSWKITSPLRGVLDFILGLKRVLLLKHAGKQDREKSDNVKVSCGVFNSSDGECGNQRNSLASVDFRIGLEAAMNGLKLRGYVPEVVYDIGAADGAWTRSVQRVWPDARFICFEPLVEWSNSMTSLAEESPGKVEFHQVGVADVDTELPLGITESLYDSSFAYGGRTSRTVTVSKLDTLVQRGLSLPNFVKIDVQGFERRVIEGGKETIAHADLVLMECTFMPFCGEMVTLDESIALMSNIGFVPYEFVDFLRRPLDGAMGQCDILFVKKGHWLIQDHRWCA